MNKKEKVLKFLGDWGRCSTSKVSSGLGINYPRTLKLLQEMWEAGEIVGEVETKSTYWSVKTKTEASKPKEAESPDTQSDGEEA